MPETLTRCVSTDGQEMGFDHAKRLLPVMVPATVMRSKSVGAHQKVFGPAKRLLLLVRTARIADRDAICGLVKDLNHGDSLLKDLDHYYGTRHHPEGAPLYALVAQDEGKVVGIIIIREELDIEVIQAHYNIEKFIKFNQHRYDEHGQILHFVLKSWYQCFSRHLFREALRLARHSCLYLKVYHPNHSQENSCFHNLDFFHNYAVPVPPRRQIIYPLQQLGINAPSKRLLEKQRPFHLCLLSGKSSWEPRVTVNARVVVVGASDTSLSFLEVLCFCAHLRFNNLTLISTHGFLGDDSHEDAGFLSTSHAYSSRDLAQIPFHRCVHVVTGKLVSIQRESKHVLVTGGDVVPYDYLILATGLQYWAPCPTGVDLSQPITNSQLEPEVIDRINFGTVPSNLFSLNDLHDCIAARRWLVENFLELEDNAIVYGNNLDVYTTVETLLRLGVRGSRIHLVLTPPKPGTPCFFESAVENAVTMALKRADVHVHHNCVLAQMNHGETPEPLTLASFTTDAVPLHLQCGVFFNFAFKVVDYDLFAATRLSFVVFYKKRIVINSDFLTNDPSIYAAGPLTKFSAHYDAEQWTHANFNSKEVGQRLAASFLTLFEPRSDLQHETDRLALPFKQAKIQGGKLPGGFHYLHFNTPTETRLTGQAVKEVEDREIVTGKAEMGNYFSLRFHHCGFLETLTCLSLEPIPVSNYLCLDRKHEGRLGQLQRNYQQGRIQDLHSYFRETNLLPVFHDRFPDLQREFRKITATMMKDTGDTVGTEVDEKSKAAYKRSLMKFLVDNKNLLPMFALPEHLGQR